MGAIASLLIGGVALGSVAGILSSVADGVGSGLTADPTAAHGVAPESMAPPVDTRQPDKNHLVQHTVLSQPGARITVRGTIDGDDALDRLRAAAGGADINDARAPFDDGAIDDLLTKRAR